MGSARNERRRYLVIACNQKKCVHVAVDPSLGGEMICTVKDPYFFRIPDARSFILKCNSYVRRADWTPDGLAPVRKLVSVLRPDGLYPGQIKPPADYSDIDPDEVSGKTLVEVFEDLECDT
jgi:hypothetical protein